MHFSVCTKSLMPEVLACSAPLSSTTASQGYASLRDYGRLQLGSKTCDCSLVLGLRDSSVLNSEFFFRRVPTALLVMYSDTVGFCYDRRNHCLTVRGAAKFEAHVIPGFILKLGLPVLLLLRPGLPFQCGFPFPSCLLQSHPAGSPLSLDS